MTSPDIAQTTAASDPTPRLPFTPESIRTTPATNKAVRELGFHALAGYPLVVESKEDSLEESILLTDHGTLTETDVKAIAAVLSDASPSETKKDVYQARWMGIHRLGQLAGEKGDMVSLRVAVNFLRDDLGGRPALRAAKKLDKRYAK